MLHIAKDNFKAFLSTKRNQIQDKLSFNPANWKRKAAGEHGENSFPWSISPRPMKGWIYNPWGLPDSTEQQTLLGPLWDPLCLSLFHDNSTSGETAISWFRLPDSQAPLQLKVAMWTRTRQLGMSRACSDLFPSSVCQARGMPNLEAKQQSYEHDNETLMLLWTEK